MKTHGPRALCSKQKKKKTAKSTACLEQGIYLHLMFCLELRAKTPYFGPPKTMFVGNNYFWYAGGMPKPTCCGKFVWHCLAPSVISVLGSHQTTAYHNNISLGRHHGLASCVLRAVHQRQPRLSAIWPLRTPYRYLSARCRCDIAPLSARRERTAVAPTARP